MRAARKPLSAAAVPVHFLAALHLAWTASSRAEGAQGWLEVVEQPPATPVLSERVSTDHFGLGFVSEFVLSVGRTDSDLTGHLSYIHTLGIRVPVLSCCPTSHITTKVRMMAVLSWGLC